MRTDRHLEAAFDLNDAEFDAYLQSLPEADRVDLVRARRLRQGLRSLKSTPECQLTTEHLRRAVLESGIRRPAPKPWVWGWAVAPVALIGAWLSLDRQDPAPASAPTARVIESEPASTPLAMADPATLAAKSAPIVARPAAESAVEADRPRTVVPRTSRPAARPSRKESPTEAPPQSTMILASWSEPKEEALGAPVSFEGKEAPEPVVEPEPVVVVVTESSDPTTGGHQAVEVSQESHVVFGG